MKILKISICNECNYYKGCSSALSHKDYCFSPKIMAGVLPKEIEILQNSNSCEISIPNWCPLENYEEVYIK